MLIGVTVLELSLSQIRTLLELVVLLLGLHSLKLITSYSFCHRHVINDLPVFGLIKKIFPTDAPVIKRGDGFSSVRGRFVILHLPCQVADDQINHRLTPSHGLR